MVECYNRLVKEKPEIIDAIKTGKNSWHQIISNDTCKICMARDKNGNYVRNNIDKYCITHTPAETIKFASHYTEIPVTKNNLRTHFSKHSPYVEQIKDHIKGLAETTALERIEQLDERLDPDEVISEIITRGGHRIKNEEIPVDGKLLLGALKEQGARKKFGSLRDVLEELDRVRFGKLPLQEAQLEDELTGQTTGDL